MRRLTPVLLVVVLGICVARPLLADVPARHVSASDEAMLGMSEVWQHSSADERRLSPLDLHPFSTEFYLHEFASENDRLADRQQRSWLSPVLNPVSNAASSLSKRVASLRRALTRMMP